MVFLLVANFRLEIKQNLSFGFLKNFFRRTNGIDMVLMLLWSLIAAYGVLQGFFGSNGLGLISCPRLSRNQKQKKE